ncbi:MAG: hypothetical protein P8168_14740 [Deltaproteobacteria bacterium]
MPLEPKPEWKEFDRSRLELLPLQSRNHELNLSAISSLTAPGDCHPVLSRVAERIHSARGQGSAVVLMMGAHVLRAGVQRYLIDLMERGFFNGIAMNGACAIHDFELALAGATTESVACYIESGQFGLWQETSSLNDIVFQAAAESKGLGEKIGEVIETELFPHRDVSIFAAGYRLGIPLTVHVGIGYDIVFEHPNCDGAAWGATSYRDFLRFAGVLENLGGGMVMNFGSAIMGPEVFLKALAMARNVARRQGRQIVGFDTLVCDLQNLPSETTRETAKDDPHYYFRPWKTLLVRTLSGGGESNYLRGDHRATVPQLWAALVGPGDSQKG